MSVAACCWARTSISDLSRVRCNVNVVIGLLALVTITTTPLAPVEKTMPPAAVEKMPMFLHSDAQDAVGATYVARLREALEASGTYRPVMNPADARFVIGIVTMDPNEAALGSGAGRSTVAAVTLQLENANGLNQFIYSWVLVANRDKVDSLATDLFAAIDKEIQELDGSVVRRSAHVPKRSEP
jgi:hypothetical protein